MITVRIPFDDDFNYEECEKLYKKTQRLIGDDVPFCDVVKDTFFYSFYDDAEFLGCIYCFIRDDELFLNGFGTRGHHDKNIECMKMTVSWFNCDIYAESIRKPAILCLLKTGFKKLKDNIYIYRR